jgi:hypothetical protein
MQTKSTKPGGRVLYLYAISRKQKNTQSISAEGIDGKAAVEALECEGHVCWLSRVSRDDFAANLAAHMEDLEWLASAGLRHQRAVAEIANHVTALPARFGTVFLSENSMAQHVRERKSALRDAFARVADADEWGVKIFATQKPQPAVSATKAPASGAEYLKRKAQSLQPRRGPGADEQVLSFAGKLEALAVASSPGGKASAGQPGLLWHGSFLVKRKDRKKLEAALRKQASQWQGSRRIDWSGPWPPYSFVGDHAN